MTIEDREIVDRILESEGGKFTDRGDDRGGPTKWGVTLAPFAKAKGIALNDSTRAALVTELKLMTREEAVAIAFEQYLVEPKFTLLGSSQLREVVTDFGYLASPRRATIALQHELGLVEDGVLGPATAAAANTRDGRRLGFCVIAWWFEYIGRIVSGNMADADHDGKPDNAENAAGWLNRIGRHQRRLA